MSSKYTIKQIFADHWQEFMLTYPNIRPVVKDEVSKMLQCGELHKGFALYYCEHCFKFKYVPFRCKSRFCNTCGIAYQMDRSESISKKLLNSKHRHIVFTIPKELRVFFRKDRSLLNILFLSAAQTIKDWMHCLNKSESFTPGIICGLHTFGRDLKWNPHIHMLVTEGGMGSNTPWRHIHHFPYLMLRKRWQTTLLVNLENALGKGFFPHLKNKLYSDHKEGFYVHAPHSDFNSAHAVSQYISRYIGRPAMAQSRILHYDGRFVTFWYQRHEDDKRIEETLSAFDFIKKLILHIPQKHFNMLRYYGLYSMPFSVSSRLIRKRSASQNNARLILRRWAFRIHSSFGFDPTKCSCGQYMEFLQLSYPLPVASVPP